MTGPAAGTGPARAPAGHRAARRHLRGRHGGTYVVTTALPSRAADRRLRTRRYVLSQAVRLCCFLPAALLPMPMLVRLALVAASIALPWGAVVAANAGPARTRRRVDVLPAGDLPQVAVPAPGAIPRPGARTGGERESWWYRLRWRTSYALLQAYGPAQLSGESDPREQMRSARSDHRRGVPAGGPHLLAGAPAPERPDAPLPPGGD